MERVENRVFCLCSFKNALGNPVEDCPPWEGYSTEGHRAGRMNGEQNDPFMKNSPSGGNYPARRELFTRKKTVKIRRNPSKQGLLSKPVL